jgi:hypothetical protein
MPNAILEYLPTLLFGFGSLPSNINGVLKGAT